MKKSSQIINLPVISISDGQQVGKVKSLVINPEKGSIDFLTIEHEEWQVSVRAIPFKRVVGIGEYALTIENDHAVIDLNEIPIANQLVNKKIKINNTKVMTRKGELIGEVIEFYADEETGHILGMDLKLGDRGVTMLSSYVLTFGKDIIIVKEDVSQGFLENALQLDPDCNNEADKTVNEDVVEEIDDEERVLREKQIELLTGKMVLKDIVDLDGNVLILEGTILTMDEIVKAQAKGPSVVVELSMNVEA
ncbi:PRC-barrel domain-containing protein [Bacillus sp. FJAT-29790]|uniref:PRC-barrel domain-containing protein n=1 Tax=Bacillus sp. FJAT-29790 TaxID=1895002 RepID=UPI001C23D4F6|nr:PRC-barrel domain-containing protein [Bacillus sp. FJAT-29790]MBU8879571.1 PRC-barrel domain-containing protein [Bacillus sp. FJAT-29790]